MDRQRIQVLGIPIDVLPHDTFESAIQELLLKDGPRQIIFLSVWDLLRARGKNDFAQAVKNADLVIPVSKSIVRGAAFLKQPVPERYNPFEAIISILCMLDAQNRSLYILGGKKKLLMEADRNVRATFPSLRLVGRHTGHYSKSVEGDIITAIRKASPSVVLLSEGIPDKKVWYYRRRAHFSAGFPKESGIFVYYPEAIGVFSKTAKRVSNEMFDRGLEIWTEIFHNPLKIFLIFPFIYYRLLLFFLSRRHPVRRRLKESPRYDKVGSPSKILVVLEKNRPKMRNHRHNIIVGRVRWQK